MQTIKDAYALPNLEEFILCPQWSAVVFSNGSEVRYYQIEMEETAKPKTAFIYSVGFWEWNRMPQGITNGPLTFQRLMEKCVGDIHLREVLVFLDDLFFCQVH